MGKINIGFIGCGIRGIGAHITLIHRYFTDQCNIVCICDKYKEKVDMVNSRFNTNFKIYIGEHSYIDMLKNENLDFVIISTPWEWHAKMVIECMNNGIRSGVEVPMATTLKECENIIETYKKTGIDSVILENVCWREDVLAVLNMKRFGLFGEINYASGGYMHDIRDSLINPERYTDSWRIEHYRNRIGDNYPTHGLGPVQNLLNINSGNRMLKITSFCNKSLGLKHILEEKKNTTNRYYDKKFNTSDIVKSLIQTSNGELIEITLNTTSARPYSLDFSLQGTNGLWDRRLGLHSKSSIYIEKFIENNSTDSYYNIGDISCNKTHKWEDGDIYIKKYQHPLYIKFKNLFTNSGFHGGMDWYMMNNILQSVINNKVFDISIYDSITMSAIVDLSRQSLLLGNSTIEIPDFTDGFWMNSKNYFENCFYIDNMKIFNYNTKDSIYYTIIPDYKIYTNNNDFHLYEYNIDNAKAYNNEYPIEYINQDNLSTNLNFSVNTINEQHNYLDFNSIDVRDSHYLIIQETSDIKSISFYFKKYESISIPYLLQLIPSPFKCNRNILDIPDTEKLRKILDSDIFEIEFITEVNNDDYPYSHCPIYFESTPRYKSDIGLSIGHGKCSNYLSIEIGDGKNLSRIVFNHSIIKLNIKTKKSIIVEKIDKGRMISLYINGEQIEEKKFVPVDGNIYTKNGVHCGNVCGWQFSGIFYDLTIKSHSIKKNDYWSYLIDGRPGNSDTYIAFRQNNVLIGNNIDKIELNEKLVTDENDIENYLYNNIFNNTWYKIKIYFKVKITDDLSIYSRYNNKEDLDGCIANIIINDENNTIISKYDFKKYDIENRFLNLINNKYDLKVFGLFNIGIINNIDYINSLFENTKKNIEIFENNQNNIILFFKNNNLKLSNTRYILY